MPDQRIAWRSTSGAEDSGTMHFIALSPIKTRVILYLTYGPGSWLNFIVPARSTGSILASPGHSPRSCGSVQIALLPEPAVGQFARPHQAESCTCEVGQNAEAVKAHRVDPRRTKGGTPSARELITTRPMNPALNKCPTCREPVAQSSHRWHRREEDDFGTTKWKRA